MYLTMLFALMHDDVLVVTSNNAARLYARIVYAQEHAEEIIRDMEEGTANEGLDLTESERAMAEGLMTADPDRAGQLRSILDTGRENFIPRNYWPHLLSARFWLAGSVGVNVAKVRPLLPEGTVYYDIGYGASEAKINIPCRPESGYGTLATLSVFYEFVPVGGGDPLTADQLEDGCEYEVLLTNYGGLYRYPMHDIVRVRGFTGNTPNVEFVTKFREILNIAQEKVPASGVLGCIGTVAGGMGFAVRHAQVYEDIAAQAYRVHLEPEPGADPDGIDLAGFSEGLDRLLGETFELYDRNRKLGSLNRPSSVLMRGGWQESLYDRREAEGAPRSQIKLDVKTVEPPDERWVLRRE